VTPPTEASVVVGTDVAAVVVTGIAELELQLELELELELEGHSGTRQKQLSPFSLVNCDTLYPGSFFL